MSRLSQLPRPVTIAAIAATALLVVPLTGCLYAQIPTDVPAGSAAADPTPVASPTPDLGTDLPATMAFADGADIPADAYIQWGDGLLTDDGWSIVKPDDGNGGWTYGTVDGTCTAQFWQGLIPDVPSFPGDDGATSDSMLAVILGEPSVSVITAAATTAPLSYQFGGNTDVESRQLTGVEGDRTWIMNARAFTATGVGLYVIVDCTGGDATSVLADVVDKNAVIIS